MVPGYDMKKHALAAVLISSVSLFTLSVALAHHGTGIEYDVDHPIVLKGTVTEFEWSNPHVEIYLDVPDSKGGATRWQCESLSPSRLARGGWTKDSLKPGEQVTVNLDPSRKGKPLGFLLDLTRADGKVLHANPLSPSQ